jgi:S1-C subfamily serine protease
MSKIVISSSDVESVTLPADPVSPAKLPSPIPLWARLVFLPLVLFLPLLAIIALVMRIALRATPPRTQQAWHAYLMTLLIAASFVFTASAVLLFSYMPSPPQAISAGLSELDERTDFPSLPHNGVMTGMEIGQNFRPMVMVASPAGKRWFGGGEMASNHVGAAVLLHADEQGYLFATAGHVAASSLSQVRKGAQRVLLTTGSGGWSGADVVAWHQTSDLALLWMPRHFGHGQFAQPLETEKNVVPGEGVYVIGHPEGLNFTISNGIISRLAGDTVQISAPVSPGNSGGPVYDDHGNLVGVVTAKMDRSVDPNAENLNFAASAILLSRLNGWEFLSEGRKHLSEYIQAQQVEHASKNETDR